MFTRTLDAASASASLQAMRDVYSTRHYRLLACLPLTVKFPSVVYRLSACKTEGAPQWHLAANAATGNPCWCIAHSSDPEANLLTRLYLEGFDLVWPTAPAAIMERLCAEGRAERVDSETARRFWQFYG